MVCGKLVFLKRVCCADCDERLERLERIETRVVAVGLPPCHLLLENVEESDDIAKATVWLAKAERLASE